MIRASSGVGLPDAACNSQVLTFTLNASNNYQAEANLVRSYIAKCIKILASQVALINLDGLSLNNYTYLSSGGAFPFEKSNQLLTSVVNPTFYFVENENTYINRIKVSLVDPTQLVGSSISITIYFFNYIPSLIAE